MYPYNFQQLGEKSAIQIDGRDGRYYQICKFVGDEHTTLESFKSFRIFDENHSKSGDNYYSRFYASYLKGSV